MFQQKLELILLVVQFAFLAGVLGCIGLALRKFANAVSVSRQNSSMRGQAMVASSAYARAQARRGIQV